MSAKLLTLSCLFLAIAAPATSVAESATRFHFTEEPGPHKVGLKVIEQYDYSRTFRGPIDDLGRADHGDRARPLQTLVWYPAEKSDGKVMTVADYGRLLATEISFGRPDPALGEDWITQMAPTLSQPLWAVRDAPMESGRFPVVIYAPGFSSVAWENADLCEFLASHGYVVVASPDMGATHREMTMDAAGIDAQARDISFLIGSAHSLPVADLSEIAVAGLSWGGMSNLFAAAHDNRIRALIDLDGSVRYFPGFVSKSADVHPEAMAIPMLFFAEGPSAKPDPREPGPSVLDAWTRGDLVFVHMLRMFHLGFGSMFQRRDDTWTDLSKEDKAEFARDDEIKGYGWMARYTLRFLDAHLKHNTSALAWLRKTPAQNGVAKDVLTVESRAGSGLPPTLDALKAEMHRVGFDHAADAWAAMRKDNPTFKPDELEFSIWGYRLMEAGHLTEAVELLQLDTSIYPDSFNSWDSLGEAYMKSGQKALAVESYNRSLEKDPANDHARQKLKELHADEPAAK